jgi:hypothetical protein
VVPDGLRVGTLTAGHERLVVGDCQKVPSGPFEPVGRDVVRDDRKWLDLIGLVVDAVLGQLAAGLI